MVSLTASFSFSVQNLSYCPTRSTTSAVTPTTVHFSPFLKTHKSSLSLSSSFSVSGFFHSSPFGPSITPLNKPFSLSSFSAKGYKMKTHKASAKRFRVTGTGKIMRRRAGKQHLLRKKNTKRRSAPLQDATS